jgi:hypothetical protein
MMHVSDGRMSGTAQSPVFHVAAGRSRRWSTGIGKGW